MSKNNYYETELMAKSNLVKLMFQVLTLQQSVYINRVLLRRTGVIWSTLQANWLVGIDNVPPFYL